jgi:hypothetical protein
MQDHCLLLPVPLMGHPAAAAAAAAAPGLHSGGRSPVNEMLFQGQHQPEEGNECSNSSQAETTAMRP